MNTQTVKEAIKRAHSFGGGLIGNSTPTISIVAIQDELPKDDNDYSEMIECLNELADNGEVNIEIQGLNPAVVYLLPPFFE